MLDAAMKHEITEFIRNSDKGHEQELEEAFASLEHLSPLDQVKLMFYISKRDAKFTESALFIKFAKGSVMNDLLGDL